MMSPAAMALATITVMLWILWSDSIRKRRPGAILYSLRIALFIIVSGTIVVNMIRYPEVFDTPSRTFSIVAVIVGLVGAGYFFRKMTRRE